MTDPTPDEAAAPCQKCQVYPDGTVYRTRCICPEPMTPEETLRGIAGMGGAIGDAVRDLLAERDALRTELLTTQQLLAHAERQRDEAEARLAAQQPVIDAARYLARTDPWGWDRGNAGRMVADAVKKLPEDGAASGSVEADTPAEPEPMKPRYLASVCDTCGHTYNYHASDGVCAHVKDRRLCPCGRFVDQPVREVAGTPAAEQVAVAELNTPAVRRRISDYLHEHLDRHYGRDGVVGLCADLYHLLNEESARVGPGAPAAEPAPAERIESVISLVRRELVRATRKFGSFASSHEGYAVILEEVDELWDEVKRNDVPRAVEEAVQVAAMGARFVLDLGAGAGAPTEPADTQET